MARNWPERQGNRKALILTQERKGKQAEYNVYEQNKTNGPWYEGSNFYPSTSRHHLIVPVRSVDKYTFVIHYHVDGNGVDSDKIVGVARDEKELMEKTHQRAVDYCKSRCRKMKGRFFDLTRKL